MKRCKFFFRHVLKTLLKGSTYSFILVFVLLTLNCGPATKGQYYIPETETTAREKTQNEVKLPTSVSIDLQKMPYVRNAFKESPRANSIGGIDDFYATTQKTVRHSAIITNCSSDILKAFLAKGWTPIVMIKLQTQTAEIIPVSDYNDNSNQISLQNPVNLSKRRFNYKDFETYWSKGSKNKCVLITPQQLTERDIRNALAKYLSKDAFEQISVRSR
ncbi:hypothetical protein F4X73_05420 [Candidatus Poribacteria bacterium]|nr:hypothetical protein [Candidatus Poribacteria bacterium]